MKTYSFSIGDMVIEGWEILKRHWKFIIAAGIVTTIIRMVLQIFQGATNDAQWFVQVLIGLVIILITAFIYIAWAQVLLKLVREDAGGWKAFGLQSGTVIRYVKSYLWYLLVVIGYTILSLLPFAILIIIGIITNINVLVAIGGTLMFLALIVVGCYFRIRYQFLSFAVLDYPELGSRDIFKKAGQITHGHIFQLLGFGAVISIINLVGIIPLGLGLLITIPTTKLARTKVYQYLKDQQI